MRQSVFIVHMYTFRPNKYVHHRKHSDRRWTRGLREDRGGTAGREQRHQFDKKNQLVSCCFESSQPQRTTSGLKTMFNLSPIYSAHKSSMKKLSQNHEIGADTNVQKTYTNIKQNIFEELVPSVLLLL